MSRWIRLLLSTLNLCHPPPTPQAPSLPPKKGGGGWFEVMGVTMKRQEKTGTTRLIVTCVSNKTPTGVVKAGFAVIIMVLFTRCLLPQRAQLARVNRGN